jgi:hypothetical protein
MTRDELLAKLRELGDRVGFGTESDHIEADRALLEYIGDPEITEAFGNIEKWYA